MVCGERADAGPSYIRTQAHNLDTCRLPPVSATNKIRLHFLAQDVFLTAAAGQPPTLFTLRAAKLNANIWELLQEIIPKNLHIIQTDAFAIHL